MPGPAAESQGPSCGLPSLWGGPSSPFFFFFGIAALVSQRRETPPWKPLLVCSVPQLPNYLLDLLVVDSHRVGSECWIPPPHIYFDCDVDGAA